MATSSSTVLFIHGLWLHASSWEPWVELFSAAGYAARSGLARREGNGRGDPGGPRPLAGYGIEEVTDHYKPHHRQPAGQTRS